MITLLSLFACENAFLPPVPRGSLVVCVDGVGSSGTPPASLDFTAPLTAIDDNDCGTTFTLDDGAGTTHTVSLAATDAEGAALTPDLSALVGTALSLQWRYAQPWGTVSGFSLSDADGLVLAADEGTWGGALGDAMPTGLKVMAGGDIISFDDGQCGNRAGHSILFQGDALVELEPVSQGDLAVGGVDLTATALLSDSYDEDAGCSVSDTTDAVVWAVWR